MLRKHFNAMRHGINAAVFFKIIYLFYLQQTWKDVPYHILLTVSKYLQPGVERFRIIGTTTCSSVTFYVVAAVVAALQNPRRYI